jgi:hypothetical protein
MYSVSFFLMNKRKTILYNIKQLGSDDRSIISWIASFGGILYMWLTFLDMEQMIGNMWVNIAYTQIISHWILAVLFWFFVAATVFKIRRSNKRSPKKTWSGVFGWLFSAIIIWCPSCSISLASYLWMGSFLVNMPGFWVEIKLLWIVVLVRASWTTIRDLYICPIRKH